jgi:hypothetical protein
MATGAASAEAGRAISVSFEADITAGRPGASPSSGPIGTSDIADDVAFALELAGAACVTRAPAATGRLTATLTCETGPSSPGLAKRIEIFVFCC